MWKGTGAELIVVPIDSNGEINIGDLNKLTMN